MATQVKLTLDDDLANSFKETAKGLGYLSTQEFIVESARKRNIAYRLSGLKSLQGKGKEQYTKKEQEEILNEFKISGSDLFRKFNKKFS